MSIRTRRRAFIVAVVALIGLTGAILVNTTAATAAVVPIRASFWYPWYPETEHWATHYTPTSGKYNSSNPVILARQVSQARYAGLDAFITSWWGQGTPTDKRLPLALAAAAAQGFHLAPYYEKEGNGIPPTDSQLRSDFNYLAVRTTSPGWLRVGGKPVLFIYNALTSQANCATVTRIKAANAGRFYLNMKVFTGYRTCVDKPDSWHQYNPSIHYDRQSAFSATVSPGFFKFNEAAPRLARDLNRFKADLAAQIASGTQWQLMTTFNEWGEGSSVEPATAWASPSRNGAYLDAMRAAYKKAAPPTTRITTSAATTSAVTTSAVTTSVVTTESTVIPPTTSAVTTSVVAPPAGTVTKALVFVEENHSLDQMKAGMPFLASQAIKYGMANNYLAIRHPSLPNYLAIAGGSTFGVTDDAAPASHPIAGASVFGAAITAGASARSYQESMVGNCATANTGRYAVKHGPWAYFVNERALCVLHDVPSGTYLAGNLRNDIVAGALPTIGQVTPNLDNDAHDGTLATADAWLRNWLTLIYTSPDWLAGRLAVIVTADEDDSSQGNKVLTVVIHPSQQGHVVTGALNHYSLTRYLGQLSGAPCLLAACTATDFATAFGL